MRSAEYASHSSIMWKPRGVGNLTGRSMVRDISTGVRVRLVSRFSGRRGMHIATSDTPNPNSLMYRVGEDVMGEYGGTVSFPDAATARRLGSALATRIFEIPGVTAVFFGPDFVSVTKEEERVWSAVTPEVEAAITEFYAVGPRDSRGQLIMVEEDMAPRADTEILDTDDEIVATIKELLESRIRPVVQEDGGDILFRGFDEESGEVHLQLQGACVGCPSSSATLKGGIEQMLRHYVPEISGVREVVDDEQVLSYDPQPIR